MGRGPLLADLATRASARTLLGWVGAPHSELPEAARWMVMVKSAPIALPAKWATDRGYQPRVVVIALISGRFDPPLSSSCQSVPAGESRVALRSVPCAVTAI